MAYKRPQRYYPQLERQLKEHMITYQMLADELDMNYLTVWYKMKGIHRWYLEDAIIVRKILGLHCDLAALFAYRNIEPWKKGGLGGM